LFRSSFYGLLDILAGTELSNGQREIGLGLLARIFLFDIKYATVQTAKQSCELLLKVHSVLETRSYVLICVPLKIIDSILDYSKLEASGN
jgi:hypothetical protein